MCIRDRNICAYVQGLHMAWSICGIRLWDFFIQPLFKAGLHLIDVYKRQPLKSIVTTESLRWKPTFSKPNLRWTIPEKICSPLCLSLIHISGYDVCACCAPHVTRTGEIGMLTVMNYQNYKGGVSISILCGFRALEAFRQKCDIISELMGIFTTNQEAIVDLSLIHL